MKGANISDDFYLSSYDVYASTVDSSTTHRGMLNNAHEGVPYVITFYKNENVFVFAGPF